jgi:hypothetical protein
MNFHWLGNSAPILSSHDGANAAVRYSKTLSNGGPGFASQNPRPDLDNLVSHELGRASFLPIGLTPFGDLVSGIVTSCSEKQVIRANAWRIVALMQNAKRGGAFSEGQFPRESMGKNFPAVSSANNTIPIRIRRSGPCPALSASLHTRPESFWKIRAEPSLDNVETALGAVILLKNVARLLHESVAARGTCNRNRRSLGCPVTGSRAIPSSVGSVRRDRKRGPTCGTYQRHALRILFGHRTLHSFGARPWPVSIRSGPRCVHYSSFLRVEN